MGEEHMDRQFCLAGLRELRPVRRCGRIQIDEALIHAAKERERGHGFTERPYRDNRVLLPFARACRIRVSTPQVDHSLAVEHDADGRAEVAALSEVLHEFLADAREPVITGAVNHGRNPMPRMRRAPAGRCPCREGPAH